MNRDQGPRFNVGPFVDSKNDLILNKDANTRPDPESGIIAKKLHDHPIMKFLLTTAGSIGAAYVAGRVVRGAGMKIGYEIASRGGGASHILSNAEPLYRSVRATLDELEGVERFAVEGNLTDKIFLKDDQRRLLIPGTNTRYKYSWYESRKEIDRAREAGKRLNVGDSPIRWGAKQEIQQRMIQQARRLPYELPAMYVTQKAIIDPITGEDPSKRPTTWYNPVDVFTDFVTESTKNIATAILPFEAASGAASAFTKNALTYGDDMVLHALNQQTKHRASVGLRAILDEVGHDAGKLVNTFAKRTAQLSESFNAGINASRYDSMAFRPFNEQARNRAKSGNFWNYLFEDRATSPWTSSADKIAGFFGISSPKHVFDFGFIDQIPGPFRGIVTGAKAAQSTWREVGLGYDTYQQAARHGMAGITSGKEYLKYVSGRGGDLEDLSGIVSMVSRGGPTSRAWKQSQFYSSIAQQEYKKIVRRQLIKTGVSETNADEFLGLTKFAINNGANKPHESWRLMFGDDGFYGDKIGDDLFKRLTTLNSNTDAKTISKNIVGIMDRADARFASPAMQSTVNTRANIMWSSASERLIPQFGEGILKKLKPSYFSFDGDITPAQLDFLKRKTVQSLGGNLTDSYGVRISNVEVDNILKRAKFSDPNDKFALRSFLASKKQINQPWNFGSANLFGLQPVLASEAINKGLVQQDRLHSSDLNKLLSDMKYHDPVSRVIGDYAMPGLYKTSGGAYVNTGAIKNRFKSFLDTVSREFQIPIVGIKPFETLGSRYFQAKQANSILQVFSASDPNPFIKTLQKPEDSFYIWGRVGGSGYKGRIIAGGIDDSGIAFSRALPGTFTTTKHSSLDMAGKHARMAVGRIGKSFARSETSPVTRSERIKSIFKDAFNISPEQDKSLSSFARRFWNRKTDPHNPYVMAKFLAGDTITERGIKYHLDPVKGIIDEAGKIRSGGDIETVAQAFEQGFGNRYLRNFGLNPRVVGELSNKFDDYLRMSVSNADNPMVLQSGTRYNVVTDIKTEAELTEAMRIHLNASRRMVGSFSPDQIAKINRSDDALVRRYLDEASGPSWWRQDAPQSARSDTIVTRFDQAKQDLTRAIMLRKTITNNTDFVTVVADMQLELQGLKTAGKISGHEYSESMAALLSLQVNFLSFKNFNPVDSRTSNIQEIIGELKNLSLPQGSGGASVTKQMLDEVASGNVGAQRAGLIQHVTPGFRRNFSVGVQQSDAIGFNPFGRSSSTVLPTLSTAYGKSPVRAFKNTIGLTSWSDPEYFTPGSIPVGHMFERLNRFGSVFNMALNTDDFAGPLGFYAKGIVGKRALPLMAVGAGGLTIDRTLGAAVYGKDDNGEWQYRPLVTGTAATAIVHGQAAMSGIVPGGSSYQDKLDQLTTGNVPIRTGRYFPLGNTPWRGGKIKYYGPSWYERFMSGHTYTDDTFGSPLERFAFGYDFSPLRPLSPYHYENKTKNDRPYPLTGEYFTGPWGPLTPALNMTVGKLLKPQLTMHRDELNAGLAAYVPVGESGAAFRPLTGSSGGLAAIDGSNVVGGNIVNSGGGGGAGVAAGFAGVSASNAGMLSAASQPYTRATGYSAARESISSLNAILGNAGSGSTRVGRSALPVSPTIVSAQEPVRQGSIGYQAGNLGYHAQELFGIYGFAFGTLRETLGMGNQDFSNRSPVLQSASKMTSSTRQFWEWNLGGLGDAPLSAEGDLGNIEFSEIVRRFVPKERPDINYVNPILNSMNQKAPWLPGSNYFIDFKTGDPYTKIESGEARLPGKGYTKLNQLSPDGTGAYGLIDRLSILADVAPYSDEYKAMLSVIKRNATPAMNQQVAEIEHQVAMKKLDHEFVPYKYKYSSPWQENMNPVAFSIAAGAERIAHLNTVFNTKFLPHHTALEDWERNNVYGSTFPQWSDPVSDFLKPTLYSASQRNPVIATAVAGTVGTLFASSAKGKALMGLVGGVAGLSASLFSRASEAVTGRRYIPSDRRKEIALEENIDILTYLRSKYQAAVAQEAGNFDAAQEADRQAQQTMYGADIRSGNIEQLAAAIPDRKREHFKAMLFAPKEERKQILSTAGRLERRFYQAAWGMRVEEKPDLEQYFESHELPAADSQFWASMTDMEYVKIKMGQSMGLDMSQMGYYPQQVKEANLVNPAYPSMYQRNRHMNVESEIQRILRAEGINGRVVKTPSFNGSNININAGVF